MGDAERMSEPILEVSNLSIEFGPPERARRVVDDVSFTITGGGVTGIVGESGSGKSVLVKALLRLLPEEARVEGSIVLRGQDLMAMSEADLRKLRGKEISHILPDAKAQLNPLVSVGDMMVAVIRVHEKVSKDQARARAAEALASVGIADAQRRLKAYPHELSGGMAQRVCVALSLLHNPGVVIADEPTAGLDVTVQRQVLDLMSALEHEHSAAQMFVTRDLGIVAHYCQDALVMQQGKIVERATVDDLFYRPEHEYTRRLLRAVDAEPAGSKPSEPEAKLS